MRGYVPDRRHGRESVGESIGAVGEVYERVVDGDYRWAGGGDGGALASLHSWRGTRGNSEWCSRITIGGVSREGREGERG
jgi:hypothetical protein